MRDFLSAVGLVLVIEGVLYAAAPEAMKRIMLAAQSIPPRVLRAGGLGAAALGVIIVWAVRG
jgi:uncharacterized protein YjeT (DUF2065 family)